MLQRVTKGIKRVQGCSSTSQRLPVSPEVLRIVCSALVLSRYDDFMFWAACTLAYFGFLRSAAFTVPSLSKFDPELHLSVNDISVDAAKMPPCSRVRIKTSKADPFRKKCHIYIGCGSSSICAVSVVMQYLSLRGSRPGP